jgi:hypothetical protein
VRAAFAAIGVDAHDQSSLTVAAFVWFSYQVSAKPRFVSKSIA